MEMEKAKRLVPKEEKPVMSEKQYGVTEDVGGYAFLLYMKRKECAQQ